MEDELFTFTNTKKLKFGRGTITLAEKRSCDLDSSSSSDEKESALGRRKHRKPRKIVALDPRIESPVNLDDSSNQEPVKPPASDSSSPSPPPPPKAPTTALSWVDEALSQLKSSTSASSLSQQSRVDTNSLNMSTASASSTIVLEDEEEDESFVLRVRCRGKIHKFTVKSTDLWANVCHSMGVELNCTWDQIFLSHRTVTMDPFCMLRDCGISAGDIVDAVMMEGSVLDNHSKETAEQPNEQGSPLVTVTFRTQDKMVTYQIAKCDRMQKAMDAFAASLNVAVSKLSFVFDGEPLNAMATAAELDLEDDDVVDVTRR